MVNARVYKTKLKEALKAISPFPWHHSTPPHPISYSTERREPIGCKRMTEMETMGCRDDKKEAAL